MASRRSRRTRTRGRSTRHQRFPGSLLASRRRIIVATVGGLAVLAGALFAWEAFRAFGALKDVNERASSLRSAIVSGDVDDARAALRRLDEASTRARESTDGALWWATSKVPWAGRNVEAVRVASREIDRVADEGLPGLVDVADSVGAETFRPKDGRVDLKAVAATSSVLERTDEVFSASQERVAKVDPTGLIRPLRTPMADLQTVFRTASTAASAAHDAADLLPTMLGADGSERTYLLLIMNNAEVRSLAGMPGSFAVVTAKNGKVTMGRQGSIQDVGTLKKPNVKLTKDERRVFQTSIATDPRDTAIHPDFPRAARFAASVVGRKWKDEYDGVVGVDPVTLGYVLTGTGAVKAGDGITLNGRNAVTTLLNGVYLKYPNSPDDQDDVFQRAARRIFDAVVDGRGRSPRVLRALVQAASERRLMLWLSDREEQNRIGDTAIANTLQERSDRPRVGVYVNDNGSTKMQFYLAMGTSLRSTQCLDEDRQELRTTTTLVSNTPVNVRGLPSSVTGFNTYVFRGNQKLGVMIFGPRGGEITSMTVDGARAPVGGAELGGRPVAKVARELAPGQSSVIITSMRTAAGSPGDPELRTTPGILPNDDSVTPSACGD